MTRDEVRAIIKAVRKRAKGVTIGEPSFRGSGVTVKLSYGEEEATIGAQYLDETDVEHFEELFDWQIEAWRATD